ncbi:MAG: UDP-2,3-diacylglucosamine diphosphatase LpxI [Desulfatibacillaceae bacterium]|nr:UDP-2,3-diacylglucosamine diphosphatase LpxI [Desulfatibacillaceae bacterium]
MHRPLQENPAVAADKHTGKVGLVAGCGSFPRLISKAAKARGMEVCIAAYQGQADDDIGQYASKVQWLYIGELKKMMEFFAANSVKQVIFAGGIRKSQMFEDLRLDERALAVLASLESTRDDAVMRGLANALEQQGIAVIASTTLLPEILAPKGCWTKRKPSPEEETDITLGFELAKRIGELDIGQTLIMAKGSVVAVEAMEGTDAAIERAGQLTAKKGCVVIKVIKPVQDFRFDLPAVGKNTILKMIEAGATALCLEAGRCVVFDRQEMVEMAEEQGITIVAL